VVNSATSSGGMMVFTYSLTLKALVEEECPIIYISNVPSGTQLSFYVMMLLIILSYLQEHNFCYSVCL
jgi:hypothetical protein